MTFEWVRGRKKSLLHVGVPWLVLTVAFESGFGHFVFRRSWERLGEDYNVSKGGLLPFGLVVLALSPLVSEPNLMSPAVGDRKIHDFIRSPRKNPQIGERKIAVRPHSGACYNLICARGSTT